MYLCVAKEIECGDGLCEASTLCMIEGMVMYLFWAKVRRCALVWGASGVLIESDVACISYVLLPALRYIRNKYNMEEKF